MNAAILDQSAIWYSACNEDSASEIAALQPAGRRLLCITASGSRAFDLLLADPAHIVAVDQNPAQTALAEIFAAAYRHYDYQAFCVLAGLRDDGDRGALVDGLLPFLPPAAQIFWAANRRIAANGLLYCGRWEGFLRRFRQWAGARRRGMADRLLAHGDRAAQWALWQGEWDDWQWRLFLRALAVRPLWRWGLREPGIAFVPKDFDMTAYARARFDHAARNLDLPALPFAWLLLNGAYHPNILPPYLTEDGHGIIRDRIDRLTLRTASLQDIVATSDAGAFDGASLSDYSSYCDLDEQRRVWRHLARGMRPGARVCERKFFNKSGASTPTEYGFVREVALEDALTSSDGAFFYSFIVARKV